MRNHLIGKAKSELWKISTGQSKERGHIDFVLKHTHIIKVKIIKLNLK